MKSGRFRIFIVACLAALGVARSFAAETNAVAVFTNADAVAEGLLQLQAQLHAAQLQIEESREEAAAAAQSNAAAVTLRLAQLEQTFAAQRAADAAAAQRTRQMMLLLTGAFGLAALAFLALTSWFQWRAAAQLARMSPPRERTPTSLAAAESVHSLAAPGRAMVEISSARLLEIVGQLERKIFELESGGRLLAAPEAQSADPLAEGQKFLDAGEPQKALECFEKVLSAQPQNAVALVKKAAALDKLGRVDEALAVCDRAIAADGALTSALLQKGGLLNRLGRHEAALQCYEQALRAQTRKNG